MIAALFGLAAAQAQDVSVSPIQWRGFGEPPEELPRPLGKLALEFPREMRSTAEIGYVVYQVVVDEKGRNLALTPYATSPALLRIETMVQQRWRFSPAKREGKPVNAEFTFAVLYNPASAAADATEASPRLLAAEVARVYEPKRTTRQVEVLPVNATVDEQGRVTNLEGVPDALQQPLLVAAKNWRFAPARRAGQPVTANLRVPFVVSFEAPEPSGGRIPPRVIHQERPVYPVAMRASGLRGEVVVDFVVDIEGRVRNPYAFRSLNPTFDDPAIEAVRKWRFEPGRLGDRPVNTHMQVPILFTLDATPGGGSDGFVNAKKKGDTSKLPEAFRYDVAPRIRAAVRPVYPYPLLSAKKEGSASVALVVDERGQVVLVHLVEASAPEFGHALVAAVEQFEYEPGLKKGAPTKSMVGFSQEFKPDERYQLVSDQELRLLTRELKKPQSVVTLRDLDVPLSPVSRRPPKTPLQPQAEPESRALIEFLVDDEGRARLPRIVSASSDAVGYAAVQSVASWRFHPPQSGGRAATVRAQIPIVFNTTGPAGRGVQPPDAGRAPE